MNGPTDWVSAAAIVSAGIIVGLLVIYFVRRKRGTLRTDTALRDLEARRDALVEELREGDLATEARTRLEIETANVLRQIDERAKTSEPAQPAAPAPNPFRRGVLVGFASGAGTVLVLTGLGYLVMQSAKAPEAMAQPRAMEGPEAKAAAHAVAPSDDPAVKRLEAAVQKSPDDLNARVELARAYLDRNNLMGVFDQTKYVLSKSPNDSRALTYHAVVRVAMGQRDEAATLLARATKADPSFLDAWIAIAWMKAQEGDLPKAEAAMKEAAKRHPEEKARLDVMLENLKMQAKQQPAGASKQLPEGHPPIDPAGSN